MWNDLDARGHDFDPDEDGGWRNPPYEVRVVLVGAVWAAAGVMYGLLAGVLAASVCNPFHVSAAGGVLFAFVGGWLEAAA